MNKKILSWMCGFVLLFGSCREDFYDHYNEVNDASIGMSITQVLENKGEFELFLQMIRRADLERTLSQSGLYTCFAPKDEHVQQWLDEQGWNVASMPERKLIEFINYHFMLGMKYYYDFERYYLESDNWDKSPIYYAVGIKNDTRTSGKAYPSKPLRIFTSSYLENREDDYKKMMHVIPGTFMVENTSVSVTDRDIPTSNGVVHVLDGPLMLTPRMDEAMAGDPELSIITKWFDRFSGWATIGMENDKLDTTLVKYYDVAVKPLGGKILNIADESFFNTSLLPNNAAMEAYFKPYFTPDQLVEFDSVPNELVVPFLQSLVSVKTGIVWGISDIMRNSPYFSSYSGDLLPIKNDISGMVTGTVLSSNSMIYKLNKVPEIPLFSSVGAGFWVKHKRYKEWAKLIERKEIYWPNWFGVDEAYQHAPRIVLMQADDSKAWDNGEGNESGIDGYESDYLDTLVVRLSAGVLMTELKDLQFERRFYTGMSGAILCEFENGTPVFSDHKGEKVYLTNNQPAWVADNGAIFEVDGIFNQLMPTDTTQTLYRKYITKEDELSAFKELVDKAEQVDMLDKVGITKYTVLAPSNQALAGKNIGAMTKEDALKLLRKCIVSGRLLYTDGFSSGIVTLLDGSTRTLVGEWENCTLKAQRADARFLLGKSNRQGANGVLHVIDKLLEN